MSVTKWTGREVRALRTEALRITQREFAERLGFSEAVVRKWESRRETITLVRQYADAMDTVYRRLDDNQATRFHEALPTCPPVSAATDTAATAVQIRLPDLRKALDTHDAPPDGPIRSLELLRAAVESSVHDRLDSNYLRLAIELPPLLDELHRARLSAELVRNDVNSLLVQAYRAADAIADKYGFADLSARIIGMMETTARDSDDPLLAATTAYVRTELFFNNMDLATGRKLLERAADQIDPSQSFRAAAIYGSLHMRAAVVAGCEFRADTAHDHIAEATRAAHMVPESTYLGTAFGRSSVRIHQVSLGVELGDIGAALTAAENWAPHNEIPAERRSHFHIDLARARMQAGDRDGAIQSIHTAHSIAPQHTTCHPHVKEMLARLSV
ncbi:helix-turn-helix transcriptional regulator [Nocardia elegans]|uniref:helix-turn-helix domain-containing protein n=1 Tax=Nocardia elegans TaxID=300029 RepID=UPI001893BD12|nr:helix-turn-helix transcriptional regulator [Nocardia elegans]MBF6243280.1 helix-turn-helix transcriptional regulator [Nocardia elegans]